VHNTCHVPTSTGRAKEHLTWSDLDAARQELAGEVARKSSGVPYDHVAEVRQTQTRLLKRILAINRQLGHPGTSAKSRVALILLLCLVRARVEKYR
jgi:hypothetical protein